MNLGSRQSIEQLKRYVGNNASFYEIMYVLD